MPETLENLIIIGSGPAGYTAAVYAARAQLQPIVFEGTQFGGSLMTTTEVENFPGFHEGIQGPDLMMELRAQAERFGARLETKDVEKVELKADRKLVEVDGHVYAARAVILAMGAEPRYLKVPGEQEYLGRGVSSCATCDGFFFKDQDIAVVGGGDSAMEEATFLTRFAKSVTVIHRREELRASKIMVERAQENPKISFVLGASVKKVHGSQSVTGIDWTDNATGQSHHLPITGLFVAIGHDPRASLVAGQVEQDEEGYVTVQSPSSATSLPGVFAAGDLVDRHYRQAITAAGSGCVAAIDAERWLAENATQGSPALSAQA